LLNKINIRNYTLIFFGKKGGYERKITVLKAKFSAEELKNERMCRLLL